MQLELLVATLTDLDVMDGKVVFFYWQNAQTGCRAIEKEYCDFVAMHIKSCTDITCTCFSYLSE